MTLKKEQENLRRTILNSSIILIPLFTICSMSVYFIAYNLSRNLLIAVSSGSVMIIICCSLLVFWLIYKRLQLKRKYKQKKEHTRTTKL
jgi:uncharacterized membrane protein YbjE (DUF340 family)